MEYKYVVVKYFNSWDLDDSPIEIVCIVNDEEDAKKIISWLRKNDKLFKSATQSYGYFKRELVSSLESLVEWYNK